jgi:hypothetical protein
VSATATAPVARGSSRSRRCRSPGSRPAPRTRPAA